MVVYRYICCNVYNDDNDGIISDPNNDRYASTVCTTWGVGKGGGACTMGDAFAANTTHRPNAWPILGRHRRRWANTGQTVSLCVLFAGFVPVIISDFTLLFCYIIIIIYVLEYQELCPSPNKTHHSLFIIYSLLYSFGTSNMINSTPRNKVVFSDLKRKTIKYILGFSKIFVNACCRHVARPSVRPSLRHFQRCNLFHVNAIVFIL